MKTKKALTFEGEINNHIHTVYSFSPYTPAQAAQKAFDAGLEAAGSVDHDSVGAALEMTASCAELGIGGCCGFEVRANFFDTPFANVKINNPDSHGIIYMTVQGIPHEQLEKTGLFLAPIREQRLERSRKMCEAANLILREAGYREMDFDADVLPRSKYKAALTPAAACESGGITERHILAAMSDIITVKKGAGPTLVDALQKDFGIGLSPKIAAYLSDATNPHYEYDLLGSLKSELLPRFFIQPDEQECIPAKKIVDFADEIGAVSAYAYLGDIAESPTGDKKAEKFEDSFLDELFDTLSRIGFRAVTYMPPRNTRQQLERVRRLCAELGFLEISGVDINSSRQSFNCPEVLLPEFRHLIGTTWALIMHERAAGVTAQAAFFSDSNPLSPLSVAARAEAYAAAARDMDFHSFANETKVVEKLLNGGYTK